MIDDYNKNYLNLENKNYKNDIKKIIREHNKNIKLSYEKENLTNKYTEEFKRIFDEYNNNSIKDEKLIEVYDAKDTDIKSSKFIDVKNNFDNLYGIAIDDEITLISPSLFSLIIKINEDYSNPYEINWIIIKIK